MQRMEGEMGPSKLQSFDAATLALCQQAFEDALAVLQTREWFHGPERNEELRNALAKNIIEQVAAGETDQAQLRKLALETLFLEQASGVKLKPTPPGIRRKLRQGRRVTTRPVPWAL
jgi:hypothetical protein